MGRRRFILFAVMLASMLAMAGPAAADSGPVPAAEAGHFGGPARRFDYYLALGDSLGAGWQPNPVTGVGAITDQGYASDIAAALQKHNRRLHFVDLACPGETTGSMLTGGCPYPEPYTSQIAAATAFLASHHGARVLVTLDIGANNIDGCLSASGINESCIGHGLAAISSDLPQILSRLRQAGGRHTAIYAMNYYDPFLAEWLTGPTGRMLATESVALGVVFNGLLGGIYQAFHVPVANVAGRFDTADFTPLVPLTRTETVPLNVARICTWTWMCAPAPVGPNIHADAAGYSQIADSFEQVIGLDR